MTINWKFPTIEAGFDGFNDSGIETFKGAPYSSLAREVLQNSLDARDNGDKPVAVTFEMIDVPREELPGHEELAAIMKRCLKQSSNDKETTFFDSAVKTMRKKTIPCLKIEDHNTTGLRGENRKRDSQWYAITMMKGVNVTQSLNQNAGGSYGIGKHAPFTVSKLRTVFYYTTYDDADGKTVEKMQGKSILMSTTTKDGETTQGTGYYGITDKCRPIEDKKDIPDLFRRNKSKGKTMTGASIVILGFDHKDSWADEIAAVVLSNFFHAVHDGKLTVQIDPASSAGGADFCIEQGSLGDAFAQLRKNPNISNSNHDYAEKLNNAEAYLRAITDNDPTHKRETQDKHLGRCELHIAEGAGLPQKVCVIRNGMLITEEMKGLQRFPNLRDFAAVLICHADEGNALLRKMENPEHNQFEPHRLSTDEEKDKGRIALSRISQWVRKTLTEMLGTTISENPTTLDELADVLPNTDDETLTGEDDPKFDGDITILPRPPKKISYASDAEGEGTSEGGEPGDGNPIKTHHPGRRARNTTKTGKIRLPVREFRILPARENVNRIVFTPEFSGDAVLDIYIAGDSETEKTVIATLHRENGDEVEKQGEKFLLQKCNEGKPVRLDVTFTEEINSALAIELTKPLPAKPKKGKPQ